MQWFLFFKIFTFLNLENVSMELGLKLISPVEQMVLRKNSVPIMTVVPPDQAPERVETKSVDGK